MEPPDLSGRAEKPLLLKGRIDRLHGGLFNVHGNVWELTSDCWRDKNKEDGSRMTAACARSVRGGAWSDNPKHLRAASRDSNLPKSRLSNQGFRVARTLP